jgi:hypothetical protein
MPESHFLDQEIASHGRKPLYRLGSRFLGQEVASRLRKSLPGSGSGFLLQEMTSGLRKPLSAAGNDLPAQKRACQEPIAAIRTGKRLSAFESGYRNWKAAIDALRSLRGGYARYRADITAIGSGYRYRTSGPDSGPQLRNMAIGRRSRLSAPDSGSQARHSHLGLLGIAGSVGRNVGNDLFEISDGDLRPNDGVSRSVQLRREARRYSARLKASS